MDTPALHRLLDRNLHSAQEYAGELTNHLPMALQALAELGADAARLDAFASRYVQRVRLPQAAVSSARALPDWTAALGDFDAFASLRASFAALVSERGLEGAVGAALPALWPGVAAAAFHGPIRVAHALQARHAGELAAALAYWAARWQSVPSTSPEPSMDLPSWLAAAERAAGRWRSASGLISRRMDEASRTTDFAAFGGRLQTAQADLGAAVRWAAELYARSGNFTVLHLVTGLRAVRVLAVHAAPPPSVWAAFGAAVMASGISPGGRAPASGPGWPEAVKAALASEDDHVVKLVHACVEQAAHDPHPAFLQAAWRAIA